MFKDTTKEEKNREDYNRASSHSNIGRGSYERVLEDHNDDKEEGNLGLGYPSAPSTAGLQQVHVADCGHEVATIEMEVRGG